eukprot:TRINITY_DN136_c0_g1_i1.p1 TRINITY_DN136_c0_g1~~TRINITY_DN136_c0_g1_i1.p1  ORF type:complete len:365 (-),score=71.21 TRINITY_DN136_c0_g1_i1:21-1076(-)
MATEFPIAQVVTIPYESLINPDADLNAQIEEAYGYDGVGLLVIQDVPDFLEFRQNLLPLARQFGQFPQNVQDKYAHEASHYSIGWSHGKEALKRGQFDTFKGSYYNNPQYDIPTEDSQLVENFPEVCMPNIWPTEDLPELENAFKTLGQYIVQVGTQLAHHCDKYILSKIGEDKFSVRMEDLINNSTTCKARLLHYFPLDDEGQERTLDSWCGWHNDHGLLTGLCPAMFHDEESNSSDIANPDRNAGLHVKKRDGSIVKITCPKNSIAFQIGECTQVFSGDTVIATPHAVRAVKYPESKVTSRSTFAVFMQPNFDINLVSPDGMETNVGQYKEGQNFGEFGKATIQYYYAQ